MENLENKIIAIIQNQPGVKARIIASKLGVDKTQVNSLLYGKLRNKVIQNKKYGWTLKSHDPEVKKTKPVDDKEKTSLGKLSKYYLDCITNDAENGIRVFAKSKFDLEYGELEKLPVLDNVSLNNEINKNEDGTINLKVIDEGQGFKENDTKRIFNRFYSCLLYTSDAADE